MNFDVITVFPEMISELMQYGVNRRAQEARLITINCWNPRDFTLDNYHSVDDRPYGGGPGMVMMAEPLLKTFQAIENKSQQKIIDNHKKNEINQKNSQTKSTKVIYLSPQGKKLDHAGILALKECSHLVLLCGRYEGVDERVLDAVNAQEISIGDYVLSGGELAAMVLMDALIRLLPGSLGNESSASQDSFAQGLLDCPHYTRPEKLYWPVDNVDDCESLHLGDVPDVLKSGNHAKINEWRLAQSLGRTWLRRKDLLDNYALNDAERQLLDNFKDQK